MAVAGKYAVLAALRAELLRGTLTIKTGVSPLFAAPAAFRSVICAGDSGDRGGCAFGFPAVPPLLFDIFKLRGSGLQLGQAGGVIVSDVDLILGVHVFVHPVELFVARVVSGAAHQCQDVGRVFREFFARILTSARDFAAERGLVPAGQELRAERLLEFDPSRPVTAVVTVPQEGLAAEQF